MRLKLALCTTCLDRIVRAPYKGQGNGMNGAWFLIAPNGAQAIPPEAVTFPPNDPAMGKLDEADDDNGS